MPDSRKLSWKEPLEANDIAASIFWAFWGLLVSVRAWLIESNRLMNGVTNGRCKMVSLKRFILPPPLQAFVLLMRTLEMKGANMQQKVEAANRLWPFSMNWKPVAVSV